jgi:3',5'-cyclic AMP phosphodiesterase CpdA
MAKLTVKTRFLVISDTHGSEDFRRPIDPADVAIHCGDLTEESKLDEFRATLRFLKRLDAPLKLVIAGNHDFTLDTPVFERKIAEAGPLERKLIN